MRGKERVREGGRGEGEEQESEACGLVCPEQGIS